MPENDPLLERLLAAGSMAQVEGVVAADLEEVLTAFPDWTTVPEPIRGDPQAIERYAHRLLLVAQVLDARGYPGPLRALESGGDDLAYSWSQMLARSQTLSDAGRYADSVEVLASLLSELDQMSGPAVDDLRPKVFGRLGSVWFQAGDVGQALVWTERALEACLARRDTQGIAAYRDNLQVLQAVHLPAVDPEAGARLLECRRLIVAAQSASDHFEYDESNQALGKALAIALAGGERLRADFAGKVYGLRGLNHYYLGDGAAARADTERALAECRAADDPNGVRTYTANLKFLSRTQEGQVTPDWSPSGSHRGLR